MPGRITLTLVGSQELSQRIAQLGQQGEWAAARALYAEGVNLRTDAMDHCPVETGTLKKSHYTSLPEKVGEALVVEVGAGGWAKKYAVYVHERTELRHKVGEAKWLENALKRASSGFTDRLARLMRHFLETQAGPPTPAPGVIQHPLLGPNYRTHPRAKLRRSPLRGRFRFRIGD